jgi:YHS domain-containing protein
MANPRRTVERYLSALYSGDAETARQCLADELSFRGPAASVNGADNYMKASAHAVGAVKGIELHRLFVDGSEAAAFYDLHIDHPVGSIAIADWYQLEGDRICAIRTILDTGPLVSASGQTAVDPVCGMQVAKATAAATRMHGAQAYYFCTAGCAGAFDLHPEVYVTPAGQID